MSALSDLPDWALNETKRGAWALMAQDSRGRAEGLLVHYMRAVWVRAGLNWDSDNEAEMGVLIDALHEMVVDEVQEHAESAPHLYPDGSST